MLAGACKSVDDGTVDDSASGRNTQGAAVGSKAPPTSGVNLLTGAPLSLQSMARRPAVVVFWAHWCQQCRSLAPALEAAYREAGDRYDFLTVSTAVGAASAGPDVADPAAFVRTLGVTVPTIVDTDGRITRAWRVGGYPALLFLDPDRVVRRQLGGDVSADVILSNLARLDPGGRPSPPATPATPGASSPSPTPTLEFHTED